MTEWQWQGGSGVIRFASSARSFWWQFRLIWSSIERDMAVVVLQLIMLNILVFPGIRVNKGHNIG
jgi:hypothetical protein